MSDTPRTDASIHSSYNVGCGEVQLVNADLARTLEREIVRLQKKCDEWQREHAKACEMIQAGKRETAQWVKEAKRLVNLVQRLRGTDI